MTRCTIGFFVTLAFTLLVAPLAADAQQVMTVHRIGRVIAGNPPTGPAPSLDAFRQGLRDLGYVEGQHLVIEHRAAKGSNERLPHLVAELVQLPVEVLGAQGAEAIRAAQQATRTIPIVMVTVSDVVAQGFAASLARPGHNITGVAGLSPELSRKRVEFLTETVPHLSRVAVLVNPTNRAAGPDLDNLTMASRLLGLHPHILELRSSDALDDALLAASPGIAQCPQKRRRVTCSSTDRRPVYTHHDTLPSRSDYSWTAPAAPAYGLYGREFQSTLGRRGRRCRPGADGCSHGCEIGRCSRGRLCRESYILPG
jgi:hypothetical protein